MSPKKRKNKKNKKSNATWLVVVGTILFAAILIWINKKPKEVATVYYVDLNITIPNIYTIFGIDISTHQGAIQWQKVKAMQDKNIQLKFAFIKATEGVSSVDNRYKHNWQNAKTQGIARGAYHFFIATKSGKLQAENFIKNVTLLPGDLPPVVDIEELYGSSKKAMQQQLDIYLHMIEAHYQVRPLIYSYASFYKHNLGEKYDKYPLWIAHYYEEEKPDIKRGWAFWQQSEVATVYGIKTKVDFDIFSGDCTAFNALLIQ